MRVVINITPDMYDRIRQLVSSGRFGSIQTFVDLALANQLYLEESESVELMIDQKEKPQQVKEPQRVFAIDYNLVDTQESSWVIDAPLWGQINRFFPLKIIVRSLARLQADEGGGMIPLSTLKSDATEMARAIQVELRRVERIQNITGDERLSTALPASTGKSKSRFKNQFIGYVQADGRPRGAISDLRLGVIQKSKKSTISLTDAGLEFARLTNPILDLGETTSTLNTEEQAWMISHFQEEIPTEWKFMKFVLDCIRTGSDRPQDLNQRIGREYDQWSKSVVNTNRVGVLSRLLELNLIHRVRDGIRVEYRITSEGSRIAAQKE